MLLDDAAVALIRAVDFMPRGTVRLAQALTAVRPSLRRYEAQTRYGKRNQLYRGGQMKNYPRGGIFARPGDTFSGKNGDGQPVTIDIAEPMSVWRALGKLSSASPEQCKSRSTG